MRSLLSWLLSFFAIMYWLYRVLLTLTASLEIDMGVKITNLNLEIIMLFATLLVLLFVFRRWILRWNDIFHNVCSILWS